MTTNDKIPSPAGSHTPSIDPLTGKAPGYTMADAELERVAAKAASGTALDPVALEDPTGVRVEGAIMKVAIVVLAIGILGVLAAQVSCKALTVRSAPNFDGGVTEVAAAGVMERGIIWAGEVERFNDGEVVDFCQETGELTVAMTDNVSRTFAQVAKGANSHALAVAMNAFADPEVSAVTMIVRGYTDPETGDFTTRHVGELHELMRITWQRTSDGFSSTMIGYEPQSLIITGVDA